MVPLLSCLYNFFMRCSAGKVIMVRVSVLNDALKSMYNAEKCGKRQALIRPSSKATLASLSMWMITRQGKLWLN